MARHLKLPSLPPLPADAWAPAKASGPAPREESVRSHVEALRREDKTVRRSIDLNDPRLRPSNRPPSLSDFADDNEATRVDPPSFAPLRAPRVPLFSLEPADEAPTTIFRPQPTEATRELPPYVAFEQQTEVETRVDGARSAITDIPEPHLAVEPPPPVAKKPRRPRASSSPPKIPAAPPPRPSPGPHWAIYLPLMLVLALAAGYWGFLLSSR